MAWINFLLGLTLLVVTKTLSLGRQHVTGCKRRSRGCV